MVPPVDQKAFPESDHGEAEPSKPPLTISSPPPPAPLLTVTFTVALEPTLPAASKALVWSPWPPFDAVVVFQAIWYGAWSPSRSATPST